jgi:NAD(P) transhydrogenase subunit alpha
MRLAVLKESVPGERRVALAPACLPPLVKAGWEVLVESGAGLAAGFLDDQYLERGAKIVETRGDALAADVVAAVRITSAATFSALRKDQVLIAQLDPLGSPQVSDALAKTGATCFALELVPRTTRAQAMDVLSSMATVAGYRAVLLAAVELPKMFPLLMTAAGTVQPARVLVLGAGVAGLQAIASAKRLGAIVHGYDVRPACREQVESLGGKFIELGLESAEAEDKGGYAKAQSEDFAKRQQAELGKFVSESDVVITTAAIPGKRSPVLFTEESVAAMRLGSVIIDLAAERGGNCPLTRAGERVEVNGVTILGPTNLPSEVPYDASLMFGNNLAKFVLNMYPKGQTEINVADDIVQETLVAKGGDVVHPRVRLALGHEPSTPSAPEM